MNRVVVIEDDEVLAGLAVSEHVIAGHVEDTAGLNREYVRSVAVDERELLFQLEHLLFPPQDDVAGRIRRFVLVADETLLDGVGGVHQFDAADVVGGHARVVSGRGKKDSPPMSDA